MNKSSKYLFAFLQNVLFLLWILTGGSVLSVIYRNGLMFFLLVWIILMLLVSRQKVKKKLVNAFFASLSFVSFCVLINYLFSVKPQDINKYIFIIFMFVVQGLLCIYFFSAFTYDNFLKQLYKILTLIRWHAFLSAIVITIFPFLLFMRVENEFNGYQAQSFLFIFNKITDQYSFNFLGLSLIRNQGLFWEPGVLQFYLNLLLIFQLYIFKAKRSSIVLTIITLITTYSTTAYGIMLIILSVAILKSFKRNPLSIVPVILAMVIFLYPLISSNLENKLQGDKQTSSMVRFYDLVQQLIVIKSNFFTGVGLDDQRYAEIRTHYLLPISIQNMMDFTANQRGSSNSILFLLGTMGIPLGGFWLFAYIKQPFIRDSPKLVSVLLILGVMVEPLLLKPFFITFIFSGFIVIYYKLTGSNEISIWKPEKTTGIADMDERKIFLYT
jgi:hypothetical protein